MIKRLILAAGLVAAGCSRSTEMGTAGNVNLRLTFTPAKVSADAGTTLVTIDVDNFAGDPLTLEDIKINTSAGFDKVGAITANGTNRFTAALQGLTDLKQSPVKVTVSVGRALQTGYVEIVPGTPSGLKLELDKDTVSADEGIVNLKLRIVDKAQNVTPAAITLTTTAGVVSQLVSQPDGSYTAQLTGLEHTADSPVSIAASAGDSRDEAVVQILSGALDHFNVGTVPSPIVAGEFMTLTVSARDKHDNLVTAFEDFVNVRSTRSDSDVEVSHKDAGGNYVTAAGFTRQFILGVSPSGPGEEFRVKTAAAAPGISLIVADTGGHRGQSNAFVVDPAPANQIVLYSQTGYNLIVSADGCVKPTVAGPDCLVGATKYPSGVWKQTPMATRLEIKLRRYTQSPDEVDGVATLLGGRGNDFLLTLTDTDGDTHCVVTATEACQAEKDGGLPYLGPLDDQQNGKYYVNVYNLRDQAKSPYTITARFVSLVQSIDVSVVPGDLNHFGFPDMPAQRAGALGLFVLNVTARDLWENQVFSFQDTTSVFVQYGTNPPRFLTNTGSAVLGATFPFTVTIPTAAAEARLLAQHSSGVTGLSNPFRVIADTNVTTNFLVLLPGQYDANPPAAPGLFNPLGTYATLTPDVGEVTSPLTPDDQVVDQPFQILILARVNGAPVQVPDFNGTVLLGGIASGFEVVDDSCAYSAAAPAGVTATTLTPAFNTNMWVGTGSIVTSYESGCYVWVRATQRAEAAYLTADAGRSSGVPLAALNGDQSSAVRVRSTEAVALRFANIPTPQLATADPAGGKNLFTIQVAGVDAHGNTTDNVYCASPVITSNVHPGGVDVLNYTRNPAPAFDANGVLTIDDAWINLKVDNNHPVNLQLTVSCGVAGMLAQSNVFTVVNAGAVGWEFTLLPARVKAHQSFQFSARACNVMDGAGKRCASENDVARTFSYAVSVTDYSGTLTPRQTKAFASGILDLQTAMVNKAGTTRICLFGVGAMSCSDPITVEIGDVSYFAFDNTVFPTAVTVGNAYAMAVTAYDAGGNAMPNYFGRIYLSDYANQIRFANNGLASADVTTVVTGGKPRLKYCTDASCATTQTLQVYFNDAAALDYLIVTDNRGHTGYSLPKTFKIVYGPVGNVVQAPCQPNTVVRQSAYFTLCAQAQAWNARTSSWVLKKDYASASDSVIPNYTLYPNASLPFVNGVAQKSFYVAATTNSTVTLQYRFQVAGTNYPTSPAAPFSFDAYAPAPRSITTASTVPYGLKVNTPFKLALKVKNAGVSDASFRGVLRVTDSTGSITPWCGAGQPAGTCGYIDGFNLITGNFSDPFYGERDQWFTIPTENYGGYLWVTDGFGQSLRVGPFDVEGNLGSFTLSAIPDRIPAGVYQRLVVTAWDIYGQVMTTFRAPVLLDNVPHNVNPDGTTNPWPIPATAWTNGVADISFRIPVASTADDKLTVKFVGSTTIAKDSNVFRAETPHLTKFVWSGVPMQQPGYVDFPITISARDQFDSLFLYNGKVLYSTGNAGYAVRPTMSTSFINGVVGGAGNPAEKIAIDGLAGGNLRLTATQLGGAVTGAASPVTVVASTIQSFSVAFTSGTLKTNCTYGLVISAWTGPNGTGSIVSGFTGTVGLRWSDGNVPYDTVPSTNYFQPAVTPKFVNGQLSTTVKILGQTPSNIFNLPPPAMNLNVWIVGSGIQGLTTATYDVQPAGSCP